MTLQHSETRNVSEPRGRTARRGLSRRDLFGLGAAGALAPLAVPAIARQAWAEAQSPPPAQVPPSTVQTPAVADLKRIARRFHLSLTESELEEYRALMGGVLGSYKRLDLYAEPRLPVKYPREPGYRPPASENGLNAWYWRCSIKGAASGPLAGKRIAVKDNVCVAGVPMMNGANMMEGYVPDQDATIVTRMLDAGAEIVGKAVCEQFCFSGSSHTSDTGYVRNPHDPARSAGGSSSGSAALVAAGQVDMAIGGDQGGSIRIPSSYSGAVGHKPTYGLVPYTGVFPIELTLDHTGPIAGSAADCALLLEVLAGPDGLDPRQARGWGPGGTPMPSPATPRASGSASSPKGSAGKASPRTTSTAWCAGAPSACATRAPRCARSRCRCTATASTSGTPSRSRAPTC